ncbi:hypothetical protein SI65_08998 [Aspergillus cristatus]|uniref:Uncharacterized protein n=1 Tax=Aspergillus cristatus TaxID=573508 RepID=A0A1E3B4B5_ASPCR|nr:hypothetical protein SI65_08998 [Aspergillus cristatus]
MATQPLLHYLSVPLPTIGQQDTVPGRNTMNLRYGPDDISEVVPWPEFSYDTIIHRYGVVLNQQQIQPDPFDFPPRPIRDEPMFTLRCSDLIFNRIRRALHATFQFLRPQLNVLRLSEVSLDGGSSAEIIDQFRPDIAFSVIGGSYATNPNRAPGDLKVSWKWRSSMHFERNPLLRTGYFQVLAQVNFYMMQHGARHGAILTDKEFVAVKRLDANGRIAVSESILWSGGGEGRLSVLMGLWYLGMLSAEDENWALQ